MPAIERAQCLIAGSIRAELEDPERYVKGGSVLAIALLNPASASEHVDVEAVLRSEKVFDEDLVIQFLELVDPGELQRLSLLAGELIELHQNAGDSEEPQVVSDVRLAASVMKYVPGACTPQSLRCLVRLAKDDWSPSGSNAQNIAHSALVGVRNRFLLGSEAVDTRLR